MRKALMITTAAVLLAGPAYAQSTSTAPATTSQAQVITQQTADQWLASKFKGTDVVSTTNEKIGDVSDILFEKDGRVVAYIVGVGGFLGIGAKDVALAPASFQMQPATDREEMKLRLSMTKDELKNMAEFKPYTEPRRTTSTSPAPTTGMGRDSGTPPASRP